MAGTMTPGGGPPRARDWVGDEPFPWPAVHDLAEGELLVGCFAVAGVQRGTTRHDKLYLKLQLADRHGTVEARIWDDAERVEPYLRIGVFVGVRARVEHFNEQRQLKIDVVEPIRVTADELELFLPRSRRSQDVMEAELERWLVSVADPALRALLLRLLTPDSATGAAFRRAPAAKYHHHAYVGGLLEHTLSVVGVCHRLAEHYGPRLDRDLLIAGALLHDIGKTREIGLRPGFAYTDEGKLLGHILIGLETIRDEAAHVPEMTEDRLTLLLHLVASHQGRYEWQSPREPRTLEALALHYADDLDSKMQQALDLVDGVDAGWTAYDRSLGRELFKHVSEPGPATAGAGTAPPPEPSVFDAAESESDADADAGRRSGPEPGSDPPAGASADASQDDADAGAGRGNVPEASEGGRAAERPSPPQRARNGAGPEPAAPSGREARLGGDEADGEADEPRPSESGLDPWTIDMFEG